MELGRISFKGTLDAVRHFADAIHAATGKPRRQNQLYEELLTIIAATSSHSVQIAPSLAHESDAPSNINSSTNRATSCASSHTKTTTAPQNIKG